MTGRVPSSPGSQQTAAPMTAFGRSRGGGGGQRFVPGERAKNLPQTLRRLWQYIDEQRRGLILLAILVCLAAGIGLIIPYLIGRAIDAVEMPQPDLLSTLVITLLTAYLLEALLRVAQGWTVAGLSTRIVRRIRSVLFDKCQHLPIPYFDKRTHGEVMSRFSNDMEAVGSTMTSSMAQLINSVLTIGGSFILMMVLSPILTLASMITIPLVFFVTRSVTRRTRVFFREQQATLGQLNGHIEEMIIGFPVVKAFNQEQHIIDEFDKLNTQLRTAGTKAQIWSGYIMPMMSVINNIGFAGVAAVGGLLAANDLITVGVIASFLAYSRQFVRPLNEVAATFNTLQAAIAGIERVFEVLDEAEEPADEDTALELKKPEGVIRFRHVDFHYEPEVPVLRNIDFSVEPGTSIALVGPTGAGKTTIVNLIARFYDITGGKILLDGQDLRTYRRSSLRSCLGVVLQDTYLFAGTIADNIRYGRLDASQEEIRAAAKAANAHGFIQRLPHGYQTVLAHSGGSLSQGQRQLLAIARAILANPAILILDEATSSVDTRTELRIQEAMLELMQGRTSFIIAHRLSTIRDADCILVIDQGRIVEQGNHHSLMQQQGIYYQLYASQYKNAAWTQASLPEEAATGSGGE